MVINMEYVRSALTCVLIVALTAAVQGQLVHTKYEKYTRFLSALILLCVLISPMRSLMKELCGMDFTVEPASLELSDAKPQDYLLSLVSRQIKDDIRMLLVDRYGLSEDQIGIDLTLDESNATVIRLTSLRVTVKGDADGEAIQKEIGEKYDCESVSVMVGA